jgi:hypothetical protein
MLRQLEARAASSSTAPFQGVARQLIPASAFSDTAELVDSTQQLFAILGEYLVNRFGPAGYQTMFDRALRLATMLHPSLRTVRARSGGSLTGLDDLFCEHPLGEATAATIALATELLSVIAALVGNELTARLIQQRWPWILVRERESTKVGARN